jgi:hypothetical protein
MNKRTNRGVTTVLVATFAIIIAVVGLVFVLLTMTIGGKRQAEHALEAASLSLISAISTSPQCSVPVSSLTPLQQSIVQGAFPPNAQPTSINMLNYNQLVGYAMIVAGNASLAPGGGADGASYTNAQQVVDALQDGPNSIAQQLNSQINKELSDPTFIQDNFMSIANSNPLGLFGQNYKIQLKGSSLGYVTQVGPDGVGSISNVSVDTTKYPQLAQWTDPKNTDSTRTDTVNGQTVPFVFVQGYTDINPKIVAGTNSGPATSYKPLFAISLNPSEPAHLVSSNNFSTTAPQGDSSDASAGKAPPFNAIHIVAAVTTGDGSPVVTMERSAVAGGVYSPTVPPRAGSGYIIIKNNQGINAPPFTVVNVANAPQNSELLNGVAVATAAGATDSGTVNGLFSADPSALQDWVNYNQAPIGTPPSGVGIFDSTGQPATTNELKQISGICASCFWDSFSGYNFQQPCAKLHDAFFTAYGTPESLGRPSGTNLLAVEAAKGAVIAGYGYIVQQPNINSVGSIQSEGIWLYHDAMAVSGSSSYGEFDINIGGANYNTASYAIVGLTGMQSFPMGTHLYASNGSSYPPTSSPTSPSDVSTVVISRPGTIFDYLNQIASQTPGTGNHGNPVTQLIAPLKPAAPGPTGQCQSFMSKTDFETALQSAFADYAKSNSSSVGSLIYQMHQIVPTKNTITFADEVYDILTQEQQNAIPLGQSFYIYADPGNNDAAGVPKLKISTSPPSNANANQTTDGTLETFISSYSVDGIDINPPGEIDITDQLFTSIKYQGVAYGAAGQYFNGFDQATWTPSSGANNLLGELDFTSGLNGAIDYEHAN